MIAVCLGGSGALAWEIDIAQKMSGQNLSIRLNSDNPNHHLWNNHGTWWLHYTLHLPDHTKKRIRKSLRTQDVEEARRLRDKFLAGN